MKYFYLSANNPDELYQQLPHRFKKLFEPATASLTFTKPITAIIFTEKDVISPRLKKALEGIDLNENVDVLVFGYELTLDSQEYLEAKQIKYFQERNFGFTDEQILRR